MAKILEESFSAWINKMPGGPHKLIVTGHAEVPTGGWHSKLIPATPAGINEDVLILDASLTPPAGPATQVISKIKLRYEESPPKRSYTNATIRYDGKAFTIDVGEAQ